jgi:hypothetical protein
MVAKKGVKRKGRKVSRKVSRTRTSSRVSSRVSSRSSGIIASTKKFNLVISNLILFAIIFVVSLGLYYVSSNDFYANMFWMVALLTGFLSVAFLLVYLILLVMRYLGKEN